MKNVLEKRRVKFKKMKSKVLNFLCKITTDLKFTKDKTALSMKV